MFDRALKAGVTSPTIHEINAYIGWKICFTFIPLLLALGFSVFQLSGTETIKMAVTIFVGLTGSGFLIFVLYFWAYEGIVDARIAWKQAQKPDTQQPFGFSFGDPPPNAGFSYDDNGRRGSRMDEAVEKALSSTYMTKAEAYTVLGVEVNTPGSQIKSAYRALVKELHPDKNPGDEDAENRFKQVNLAYETLGKPS